MSKPLPIEGEVSAPAPKNGNGKRKQLAVVENAPTSEIAWLQTIKELAPTIGIEGVRELMTMRREERATNNEREFNAAMATAQADLKAVIRNRKNKQTGSDYADLAAIADTAMPHIYGHGFGVSSSEFRSDKPDHLGIALEVMHRSGHCKRYEFHIPFDGTGMKGNPNKTQTHAYGSTATYGRRYAICCVFNIATKDDDGNAAGNAKEPEPTISEKQEKELRGLMKDGGIEEQIVTEKYNVESLSELTVKQHENAVSKCKATIKFKQA